MALDPFEVLFDLEQRSLTYAKPLPRQKTIAKSWSGIEFISEGQHFLVPLHEIVEVIPLPEYSVVPESAPWFRGFAQLRARVFPITDLPGFISGNTPFPTHTSRVLMVEVEHNLIGFLVEQVLGLKKFLEDTLKPSSLKEPSPYQKYVLGEFQQGERHYYILSLLKMIENPEFYHAVMREERVLHE